MAKAYKQSLPSDVTLTAPGKWKALGQNQLRPNAKAIVTGEHKFPSDIQRPGMLYGAMLRPPSWGATLESVDTGAVPSGVTPVREGEFMGCVAPNSYLARKAVQALAATARWNEKPHTATSANLRDISEGARAARRAQQRPAEGQCRAGAGFRTEEDEGDLSGRFCPSRTHGAASRGRRVAGRQADGLDRHEQSVLCSRCTGTGLRNSALAKVRVIVPDFGGGFGGKHTGEAAIEAARLAKTAGRPVSLRWTRAEEFMWSYAVPQR